MRVVHETGGTSDGDAGATRILAEDVEVADSLLSQARGLMFRRSVPDGYALVFEVGSPSRQFVHMLFVRFPIDVLWLLDDEVVERARLAPWRGVGVARADRILELPAGAADGVAVGDTVRVTEECTGRRDC